jgi:hypothetical protein
MMMNSMQVATANLRALEGSYLRLRAIFLEFAGAILKMPEWKDAKNQPLLKTLQVVHNGAELQAGIGQRRFAVAFDTHMGKHALMGVLRLVRMPDGLGLEQSEKMHEWYFNEQGALFADADHTVALRAGDEPCSMRDAGHACAFLLELLEKFGFA